MRDIDSPVFARCSNRVLPAILTYGEEYRPLVKVTKHDPDNVESTSRTRLRELQAEADKLRQAVDEHFARLNASSETTADPETKHRRLAS